jgi:hypothetical protein
MEIYRDCPAYARPRVWDRHLAYEILHSADLVLVC